AFAALAVLFAAQNGGVRVPLNLGVVTLRSVSLPIVVFTSVILGMVLVLLAGLKADLRTRRMLRRYQDALGGASEEP
ncbi:MAG: lipopolysaccharide assembly protein LapA domain-containing protein, partial [Candidatus Palauibacterales bacterium]|nr:lipopolysaccharide assembly protein LapA domain-containing protein [Candidatus Palauibacterales bacterium]